MRRVMLLLLLGVLVLLGAWAAAPSALHRGAIPEPVRARIAVARAWARARANGHEVRRDVAYRRDVPSVRLDLYLPSNAARPLPALLYFHGGGWIEGSRDLASLAAAEWVERGFAVANVGYRLAREARAPAAVEDARCAAAWLARHAGELGIDTARIVAAGVSAGGHLALMTALPAPDAGLDRCGRVPAVRAVVNWYGPTDLPSLRTTNAAGFVSEWVGASGDSGSVRLLSPLAHVRAGGPAVWTVHGDRDDLIPVEQAIRLHAALSAAGVRNRLRVLPGRGHGFSAAETSALTDSVAAEIHALLGGPKPPADSTR
jgi:acetyl esterase/lipase